MMMTTTMMMTMKMVRTMKPKMAKNSADFEATTSRFCMVIDLNGIYRMMMTMISIMMMKMIMKTQNGHNSANFEATTCRYCMVIDINEPTGHTFMQNLRFILQISLWVHIKNTCFTLLVETRLMIILS